MSNGGGAAVSNGGGAAVPNGGEAAVANGGAAAVLLVPLGSTEQHGPHLPFDTDTRIATTIAQRCAASAEPSDAPLRVAPALAYGSSGEHQGFAGTLSIGTEALRVVLVELARSAAHFADRVIWVNGHGGNLDAVTAATDQLRDEGHDVTAWWPRVDSALLDRLSQRVDPQRDSHAGFIETSVMMAIAPDVVDSSRLEPGTSEPISALLPGLQRSGLAAVSPNGVLGDPRQANASDGETIVCAWVRSLTELVAQLHQQT